MAFDTYGKFKLVITLTLLVFVINAGGVFAQTTWDGDASPDNDWSTAANWNNDLIPNSNAVTIGDGFSTTVDAGFGNVITGLTIGAGTDGSVTLETDLTIAGAITINSGAVLSPGSNSIFWDVASSFKVNGTFTMGTSTLSMADNGSYIIESNSSGNIDFYNINYIPGTSGTNDLTFQRDASGTPTFRINGTFKRGGRTNTVTEDATATFVYISGSTLEYDAVSSSLSVSDEWPAGTGAGVGAYNVSLNDKTIDINTGLSHQVLTKLTKSAGSITETSGSLVYFTGATLEYNHNVQQTTGIEWDSGTAPANVIIVNTSGSSPAVDMGTSDLGSISSLTLTSGILDYSGSGRTLTVSGDVEGSSSFGTTNTNTLIVNADGAAITSNDGNSVTFYNLTIDANSVNLREFSIANGGVLTINNTTSTDVVTVQEPITLEANSDITVTSGVLDLNGVNIVEGASSVLTVSANGTIQTGGADLTNYNSYSLASGTVIFDGTSSETLPSNITIGNLDLNNSAGAATSSGTLTLSTDLDLSSGVLTTTSSNILLLGASATVSGALSSSNMVVGPLRKTLNNNSTFTYPIGFSSTYVPATFNYTGISGTGIVTMEAINGSPGGTNPSGISAISSSHHYTLTQTTAPTSFTDYDIAVTWTGSGFLQARNQILLQNGASPTYVYDSSPAQNQDATTVTLIDQETFPSNSALLAIGSSSASIDWVGGSGSNWSTPANWSGGQEPQAGDAVTFTGSYGSDQTVIYDGSAAANSFTGINITPTTNNVSLTLTRSTTIDLTGGAATDINLKSGSTLIYNGTSVIMSGAAYDNTKTTYSGDVQYITSTPSVYVDSYGGDLTVNGPTGTNGTGTTTVTGTMTVSSTFTSSETFNVGAYTNSGGTATFSGSSLAVTGTTTINGGTLTGVVTANGNVVFGGGSATGTFTFSGGSAQSISVTGGSATFANVTIDKSSNDVSLSNAATINGALTLTSGDINSTSASLSLGSSATVTSGSNSSHINGPVAKTMTTTSKFTLPVGNGDRWRRVGIEPASSTSETYTVRYYYSTLTSGTLSGVDHIANNQYWTISNAGSVGANITLHWEDVSDGVDENLTPMVVAQLVGTVWTNRGGSTSGSLDNPGSVRSSGISGSFSTTNFTFGSTTGDNSLPVELVSFEANPDFDKVSFSWLTASESENLGFNLYKKLASDEEWSQVNDEIIPGQGNTSIETGYEFVDYSVRSGDIYSYKLESVSYNGAINVEKTIEIT
ncbi:MAG: hypothetical protein GY808_10915, partial [Gammaproteobacteria bacterium]|nr:hypothetical protein [Gammaproteobacteria bacterium]